MPKLHLHTLIEKEGTLYSAVCLELNVASQGKTIEKAKINLREAVELYLEDVIESKDEKEFIPRPASREEWLKFFKIESLSINRQIKNISLPSSIQFEEMVYA